MYTTRAFIEVRVRVVYICKPRRKRNRRVDLRHKTGRNLKTTTNSFPSGISGVRNVFIFSLLYIIGRVLFDYYYFFFKLYLSILPAAVRLLKVLFIEPKNADTLMMSHYSLILLSNYRCSDSRIKSEKKKNIQSIIPT